MRFEYAVYLLNKNIAQLRWHCDTTTADLRPTLANLSSLLESLTTREPQEEATQPLARLVLPLAPAVLKGVAPVLSRLTPTRVPQQQQLQAPSALGGSPGDRRPSESESISSAKDSDSGEGPPSNLDDNRPEDAATAAGGTCPSSTNTCPTEEETAATAEGQDDVLPGGQPEENGGGLLFAVSNGLDSNLYASAEEEPVVFVKDSVGVEGGRIIVASEISTGTITAIAEHNLSLTPTEPSCPPDTNVPLPSADVALVSMGDAPLTVNGVADDSAREATGGGRGGQSAEVGVAADLFWDSVTSRAQVLSVPTSFKTNRQKPFYPF